MFYEEVSSADFVCLAQKTSSLLKENFLANAKVISSKLSRTFEK
jgi:hypothetical protein